MRFIGDLQSIFFHFVSHFQTAKSINSESKDTVQQPPEEGREEAKTGSGDEREEEEEEDRTVPPAQETPQSSDTASPDTDSPVMINTDVCLTQQTSDQLFSLNILFIF